MGAEEEEKKEEKEGEKEEEKEEDNDNKLSSITKITDEKSTFRYNHFLLHWEEEEGEPAAPTPVTTPAPAACSCPSFVLPVTLSLPWRRDEEESGSGRAAASNTCLIQTVFRTIQGNDQVRIRHSSGAELQGEVWQHCTAVCFPCLNTCFLQSGRVSYNASEPTKIKEG